MRWKLWLAVFRLTSSVLWAVSVSCPQPRRKPVLLMAQARPGAPPPLEHPSNRPPTACGSYKRRDQTTIAGETRPAELETPVRSYPRPAHGGVRSEGMRRTKRLISMLPKLTKKEVNPRGYGTGVAAQSFFSTHDMMCMALQGHWPSLKRLLRESSGPEAELELPDHPSYPNPLLNHV